MRQAQIALGEPADLGRRQNDLDSVLDVEPFGMVIHLFGQERHLAQKTQGLPKVMK
jgi:hypothetical protein